MKTKTISATLLSAALLLLSPAATLAQEILSDKWSVTLDADTKTITIANDGNTIFANACAEANCAYGDDSDLATLKSTDATAVTTSESAVSDCFGDGREHTFTYTFADDMQMVQTIAFYDNLDYLVCRLAVTKGDGTTVRCNQLKPLSSSSSVTFLPEDKNNRMIFVPWDNDSFICYSNNYLRNNDMYSYNVTSIYNYSTRQGVVAGAVDHDTWKNAIHVNPSEYWQVDELELISGYTDEHTHDSILTTGTTMPHGTVVADTVKSSRFILGLFDDWREGMETFGQACTKVAPRREWEGGTPYGWSSWGVMATKVSYEGVIDVADFLRDSLMVHGFHDEQGRIVLSLDAWWNDNLTTTQVQEFVAYCKENDMIPGLYYGPFCYFGGSMESLNNYVTGTSNQYKFKDIALKQNGEYKLVDGAFCLDPTHPGTKLYMLYDISRFKKWGIEYLKCDFMSNGAIEADSWYDETCYTGIQAYNKGMTYFLKQLGDDIYVNLSIAPAFPYQYAHGRRISCDAWGTIDNTKYVMNNTSYGWWLNQVYFANDPDHLVMKGDADLVAGNVSGYETDGINRARLTSGLVTGAFLLGDNFSDNVDAGYPELSREQALKLLVDENINEIPRTCQSFRPVEGSASGENQEKLMTYENDTYVYLAAFNYSDATGSSGTLTYERLGIDASDVDEIEELWYGSTVTTTNDGFKYSVPYRDARIYRIKKVSAETAISSVENSLSDVSIGFDAGHITAECQSGEILSLSVYDSQGRLVRKTASPASAVSTAVPGGKGIYIIKVETSDGGSRTKKVCL